MTLIQRRRGMTLIEMLIVMGSVVFVVGMTLGIAAESEQVTRRITNQQSALQYSQAVMDQALRTLEGAMHPGDLPNPALAAQYQFKADTLTVASYAAGDTHALRLVTLGNHKATPESPNQVERQLQAIDKATGQPTAQSREELTQLVPQQLEPRLSFAYAAAVAPGQPVVYADTWSSSSLPALIEVTVEAHTMDRDTTRGLTLQTAVMPGNPAGGAQ